MPCWWWGTMPTGGSGPRHTPCCTARTAHWRSCPSPEGRPMGDRPLRILVAAASRHGATAEIATALAAALADSVAGRTGTLTAVALPVDHRPDPASFDAVILGSAVYAGHWIETAREYGAGHASTLRRRPVWLFSSGPIGEPPFPPDEPYDVQPLTDVLGAR